MTTPNYFGRMVTLEGKRGVATEFDELRNEVYVHWEGNRASSWYPCATLFPQGVATPIARLVIVTTERLADSKYDGLQRGMETMNAALAEGFEIRGEPMIKQHGDCYKLFYTLVKDV